MSNDYYADLGVLVLSSRFRKISERLLSEISLVYKSQNIDFEPGWFHILFLLSESNELSITEISETLQVSHPSVIQVVKVMEKRSLIHSFPGKDDKRKRIIILSKTGYKTLKQVQPIWNQIQHALNELLTEGENSTGLLKALSELESNIDDKALVDRILSKSSVNHNE